MNNTGNVLHGVRFPTSKQKAKPDWQIVSETIIVFYVSNIMMLQAGIKFSSDAEKKQKSL
jgi:hypothetical protein